ncbi:MAG: GAF domain-containing protein [Anaerolineales bacterium]|nr:GAF domain-containing protein [Anaerolineales bacterium]
MVQNKDDTFEVFPVRPSPPPAPTERRVRNWLTFGLSFGALALALFGILGALVIAIDFQRSPFLGVILNRDLEVQREGPFADESWSSLDMGIRAEDKIIGADGIELPSEKPYKNLQAILDEFDSGDRLRLTVSRPDVRSGIPQADSCQLNSDQTRNVCQLTLTLGTLPTVDFIGYFLIGYVTGLVALGISAYVMIRRTNLRAARFLVGIGGAIAVLETGTFNLLTTQYEPLVVLWIFAGCMLGAGMVSFSMVFPTNILLVDRTPISRFAPLLLGLVATLITYGLYQDGDDATLFLPLIFAGGGMGVMMAVMFWRRQYTTSPIFREQASYVLIGTTGVVPAIIWAIYQLVTDGGAPVWMLPLVQVSALLFLLSVAYAIVQARLLETDRLMPMVAVYTGLSGILVVAYAAVVTGLSTIGVRFIQSDSPILIAGVVLAITLGFVPIRARLHDRINEIAFRRRRQYQQRLETLLNKLTDSINLRDVESAVRTELEDALTPSDVILFFRDKEGQLFRAHENPMTGRPVTDITFPFDSGLVEYLEREASILYIEDERALPPAIISNRSQLAVLNTPVLVRLMGQRQLNGFIALSSRRNGEPYNYEDLQYIERVADQTALALERTQIVEDLEHRFRVQDVLSQVSRALSYAIDLDTLMELLYAQTSRVIETDVFTIAIMSENRNEMYYAFYVEGDERLEHLEQLYWAVGRDLISEVAINQQLVRTNDYVTTSQRLYPNAEILHHTLKAWMGAPLMADTATGILGVMALGTTDATIRYSDEQVQLFLDIASIAASAINKTRLFEATRTRSEQLEALNQISSQLSTEIGDVDRLLDLISRSAINILKCEAGSLLLTDEETNELVFQVALGPGSQTLIGQRIPKERPSLANEALLRKEPIIVNNTQSDKRWHGEVLHDEDEDDQPSFHSRAILTTPLLAQGVPVGVLQVLNKRDGSPFSNEDATLLTTFAAQAAVAIQNARLYALQDERLLQRIEELEGLSSIDQSLNQSLELQTVVQVTLDWAVKQSGAKAGILAILNQDIEDSMQLIGSTGYPESSIFYESQIGQNISTEEGIWGRVVRTARPSFTRDLKTDPDYIETYPSAVNQIIVPIISANEVIGVLMVEGDAETELTLLDMESLSRLADHASPAITNSQLFEQLRHQQKARADFVRFIAHELNNPMTAMKGYTDLLMRGVVGPLNEQQSNFLETVYNNVNRLEALVNDLRDVEAQDANQLSLEMGTVNFVQVIRECLRNLQQAFDKKEQKVVQQFTEDLPAIWADHRRLVQIMMNFMTNANKYTPVGGKVTVVAEAATNVWDTEGVRRVLHIQIKDTGIGISDEDLKKIFKEKYFRTDNAKDSGEPGTGLGMVLTRGLILQHGGQVWVESKINEGSTFHFTIPLATEIMREGA